MVLNIIFLYFSSLLKTHDHLKQNLLPCILGFKVYTFHFIVLTILHLADIAFFLQIEGLWSPLWRISLNAIFKQHFLTSCLPVGLPWSPGEGKG